MIATNQAKSKSNARHRDHVAQTHISSILPSPENAIIYRERSTNDSDFARLVESIRENGIQSPILVNYDDYIISGHQRHRAAMVAGLQSVPTITLKLERSDHTEDEWVGRIRLEAIRRGKPWLTSRSALERFLSRLPHSAPSTTEPTRTPSQRESDAARAKQKLQSDYGI